MKFLMSLCLLVSVLVGQAHAGDSLETYMTKVVTEPGFVQTEFDRIYARDPAGMGYVLAAYAREKCRLAKASLFLKNMLAG